MRLESSWLGPGIIILSFSKNAVRLVNVLSFEDSCKGCFASVDFIVSSLVGV